MKIVFAHYLYQPGYTDPASWIRLIRPVHELMSALAETCEVICVGHIGFTGERLFERVKYLFPSTVRKKSRFPITINRAIRNEDPDAVIVAGLHFPLQVLQLRWMIGRRPLIIARQHADRLPEFPKRMLSQLADRFIDQYFFTAPDDAVSWISGGVIASSNKVRGVLEGSTLFSKKNKKVSRQKLGMQDEVVFLWVGRLEQNKDPLTVINAFQIYCANNRSAKLYMIYQESPLWNEVATIMADNRQIILVGKVDHAELETWYSAADYFISGSHREGGSFALAEAMACGCIPIVTAIPSALEVTARGKLGHIYPAGDVEALTNLLTSLDLGKRESFSDAVREHFVRSLSPKAIADRIRANCAVSLPGHLPLLDTQ
jgi:glycosyltransferase involved in cell wall biosynthesis